MSDAVAMLTDGANWQDVVDTHALALYLICILAAVVSAHATRDLAGPWPQDRAANRSSRLALALALVFFSIALSIFIVLAATVSGHGWMSDLDQHMQSTLSPVNDRSLRDIALSVTHLGDPIVLTLFAAAVVMALVWLRQWRLVLVGISCIAANGFLVRVLKAVFERARPISMNMLDQVSGWSFPSGHAAGTMMVFASAAWFAWRLLPRHWGFLVPIVMAALTFAVGGSRIVLGVHFVSDVLAGFALAAANVALMIMLLESPWRRQSQTGSILSMAGSALV